MTTLGGKVALVTGASRGIGRACAIKLGALGARVAVNYNTSAAAADDVVARIKAGGGEATAAQGDVSDFATAQAVVKAAIAAHGRLDILVNNAGTTRDGLLATMTEEDFDAIIRQNLKSTFNCSRAVLRQMLKRRSTADATSRSTPSRRATFPPTSRAVCRRRSRRACSS